jgi:acylphosphatase
MPLARVHCIVHGRVQGVAFRAATQRQAQQLGVHGWVRNRPDGTVELLAEGEQVSVQRLVDWCHGGPTGARVTQVQVDWQPPVGECVGFEIRYDT